MTDLISAQIISRVGSSRRITATTSAIYLHLHFIMMNILYEYTQYTLLVFTNQL